MFCPNCGNNNADNSTFCGVCGTPLTNTQTSYNYEQPNAQANYTAPMYSQPAYVQPVKKKEYLKTFASDKTKSMAKLSLILTLVLLVAMIASYLVVTNLSIEKMPIFKGFIEEEYGSQDEFKENLEDAIERDNDNYEAIKNSLNDDEKETIEEYLEAGDKCTKSFSINNVEKFFAASDDVFELSINKYDANLDELEDLTEAIDIVKIVILIAIIFCVFFSILGGLFKKIFLVIIGLIFTAIYVFCLCPLWFSLIVTALHIAIIVTIKNVNKEYKIYKKNPMAVQATPACEK